MSADHEVVLGVDRGSLTFDVICHLSGADRPCAVWYETDCQCTDASCPCREDDHEACEHGEGRCSDFAPCSQEAHDECWYVHACAEVGVEAFDATLTASPIPVTLTGSSFEEAIEIEVVS